MSALIRTAFANAARCSRAGATSFQTALAAAPQQVYTMPVRSFRSSGGAVRGFEEFYEPPNKDAVVTNGRGWTAADLRRKSYDDLHKLWYVLYKERNLLLTARKRLQNGQTPLPKEYERRYISVKRSMAAIKKVLSERSWIEKLIKDKEFEEAEAAAASGAAPATPPTPGASSSNL